MRDISHLVAIHKRLFRNRRRMFAATTDAQSAFWAVQVAQAEKELAAEMQFLDIKEDAAIPDMTDDDLLAALGAP